MKRTLLASFFLLGSLFCLLPATSYGQKDSTSLLKRITKSFCDEFSKKDQSKITAENMEMELGLLILPLLGKYADEIEKEWGISSDADGLEKIGEKIGQDAALNCPEFQSFIVKNLDAINGLDEDEKEKTISGSFISIETTGVFSSIQVKNKSGKEEKFWWFEYFDGADEVVKNAGKLKSKSVTVKYKETEIYDASLKEYRKIKVITGLTVVQ